MTLEDFTKWHEGIEEEMELVGRLLSDPLSDEPMELIQDLEQIEPWYSRLTLLLAEANSYLDTAKWNLLPPKGDRMEADRKIELDSKVCNIRLVRDTIEGYLESIKQRIILGESILRTFTQFNEPKISSEKVF